MLKTSSSLAQPEEGASVRKLRECPGLAQFHVPPKFTCEVGDDGGPCAPCCPPASFGSRTEERRSSAKWFGLGHLVLKYVS